MLPEGMTLLLTSAAEAADLQIYDAAVNGRSTWRLQPDSGADKRSLNRPLYLLLGAMFRNSGALLNFVPGYSRCSGFGQPGALPEM